ncbi:phosphotransferase enzyme family protein [Krasilnikovia sp. MM14-A1259]|uniref:phosphotransferase enzyme family protein n=1 Tax=Krasilnikovia sp. MM14-A1259 TaxID=3373539 RepID=UPI003813EA5A
MTTHHATGHAAGRMAPGRLHAVLRTLQSVVGVDAAGAEMIKFTNNAVFRLPACGVVARIAGSRTMAQRAGKVVRVARWLENNDVAAVRLLQGVRQPVIADGLTVTLWQEVIADGPAPTGADLARILSRMHALSPPDGSLPDWDPITEIRQRLEEPEGVPQTDITFLRDQCDRIEVELANLSFDLPRGPIHGDAFMGNLIAGRAGPVICDFDSTCIGPREWDLAPLAVGKLRFDYPDDAYGELAHHYGFDVLGCRGFPTLRRIRELKLVTSVIPVLGSSPAIRPQWEYRLRTYRAGDQGARWSTYRAAM